MVANKEGQSILEILLALPLILGLILIMVKINEVIQVGIVNQQYSRAQTLYLAYNSPYYPLAVGEGVFTRASLISIQRGQMIVGVSDTPIGDSDEGTETPVAPAHAIIGFGATLGSSDPDQEEPIQRGKVRIRNTVSLCTPSYNEDKSLQVLGPTSNLCALGGSD